MHARTPVVVTAEWQVKQELRSLGLTPEVIKNVAMASAAAKADTLAVDPLSAPGTQAYNRGIRSIRLQLLPDGWRISRVGNVESTVSDSRGIQVCFQNVDLACGARDPQANSPKGSGARRLIRDGQQGELFERSSTSTPIVYGSVPTVWVICVSTSENRLRAEVSCPDVFEGDQFDGFSKRIFVVDESLDPTPTSTQEPDDGVGPADYEVRIAKK